MNSIKNLVTVCFTCLLLASCSSFITKPSVKVSITPPEQNRIKFSGKGAGAGMMLMSSMGPMGMAVGVAIDEGIGKDIHETAVAGGVDVIEILNTELQRTLNQSQNHGIKTLDIKLERYGFKTVPGENDLCVVDVQLSYSVNGGEWIEFSSGELKDEHGTLLLESAKLDFLKTGATAINEQFVKFSQVVIKKIVG